MGARHVHDSSQLSIHSSQWHCGLGNRGTVHASQQCGLDLVVNSNLIALLNQHILLQLCCDITAEAGASAWVGEDTQALSTPLSTRRLITAIAFTQNLQVNIFGKYITEVRAMREHVHSPGPRKMEGACILYDSAYIHGLDHTKRDICPSLCV